MDNKEHNIGNPGDRALEILEDKYLCDHCLGRQHGLLLSGTDNKNRGQAIRNYLMMYGDIKLLEENDPTTLKLVGRNTELGKKSLERRGVEIEKQDRECWLCGDIFSQLDKYVQHIVRETQDIEFNTFLVGTKLTSRLIQKEEEIWAEYGAEYSESLKSEFNREIGKRFEEKTDAEVEFENPEVVAIINLESDEVEIKNNPIFFYGRYIKHARGIPQTEWHCPACRGEGCMRCEGEGTLHQTSIEEIIGKPILRDTEGKEAVFHGAGREDLDVKMLGDGRPFVIEIKEPKKRKINKDEVIEEINSEYNDKIEINGLKPVDRDKIKEIKEARAPKTYRAKIKRKPDNNEISREEIKKALKKLEGKTIKQKTPRRISRRPEKTRKRKVHKTELLDTTDEHHIIKIKTEAGAYVKELISGDKGNTKPSLAELLKKDIKCIELDVLEVHYPK
ncbi:MAG: tRNA pseudouridine(54/55) synthase Pus10 [Methanonatronarchaeia archaeon]|nr:MAG: tRNA pseudouridine(54/55) synthase Pus10 [Methanonatronarchaeia archaeon]